MNLQTLEELIETRTAYLALEKKLGTLKDQVKKEMLAEGLKTVNHGTSVVTITHSTRVTPSKTIVDSLVNLGLVNCLKTEIKPDIDVLKSEIGVKITPEQFKTLVKETDVYTMNIK